MKKPKMELWKHHNTPAFQAILTMVKILGDGSCQINWGEASSPLWIKLEIT